MSRTRRVPAVAAALVALLVAACGSSGNGEDGKSANQIVSDATTALRSATSYHLAGTVDQDGSPVKVDIRVDGANSAAGHIDQDGTGFDFVFTGDTVYLRGQDFVARISRTLGQALGDRWLKAPPDDPNVSDAASAFQGFTKAADLADSLGSGGGPFSKSGTGSVDGQSVVFVKGKDGTMAVAASGRPYPLRIDGGDKGRLDITQYGTHFGISAPKGAVDVASLSASSDSSTSDSSSKAVVDATKVRDGVMEIARATITGGSPDDAWGVEPVVAKSLPSDIEVSVQQGDDLSSMPPATPTRIIVVATTTSDSELFMVVALDTAGTCEAGSLSGTPPNQNPQTATVPSGQDCTAENAASALGLT